MPGVRADGMDVLAVAAAMLPAVERARAGRGPTLIECKTYRFLGHSKSDQRVYRSREEEATWRERDPIARLRAAVLEQALVSSAELDAIARDAVAVVDEAVTFAQSSPFPELQDVTAGVFSDDPCVS
jgi:TPP-dependent pyruvate/acetoin dehydrogenase alpha subunit